MYVHTYMHSVRHKYILRSMIALEHLFREIKRTMDIKMYSKVHNEQTCGDTNIQNKEKYWSGELSNLEPLYSEYYFYGTWKRKWW